MDTTPTRDDNGLIPLSSVAQKLFDAIQSLPTAERNAVIQNCIAVRAAEKAEFWRIALERAEQRRAANPKQETKKTYTKRPAYKTRGASHEGGGLL